MGFWRALLLSAVASFAASSCALQLPWIQRAEEQAQALREPALRILDRIFEIWQEPAEDGATFGAYANSFSQCQGLFPPGTRPQLRQASSAVHELCFDGFALLYSAETKTPVYVVERLSRAGLEAAKSVSRTDQFYPEARVPASARAQLDDYRNSGWARGHMAPAGDMPNAQAMAQSFSLANIVPQDPSHNSGAWNKIEQDTRKYAQRASGDVYVFTGPAFQTSRPRRMGDSGVAVPTHLFKLVYDPATGRAWAHWHQNQPGNQSLKPISYAALVRNVQIDFLAGWK